MKRLFIVAAALILGCSAASAQNKGDMYFGGYTGLALQAISTGEESSTAAAFAFKPEFGYFVANNWRLGISAEYSISGGIHTITAMPNFAYYLRFCDGLYYTPGAEIGFALGATEGITMPGVGMVFHAFSLEFRPSKRFGFSANLLSLNIVALQSSKYNISSTGFNFNIGLNPTIGIKYYF